MTRDELFNRLVKGAVITESGCWLHKGGRRSDYGSVSVNGKSIGAHRAMWYAVYGRVFAVDDWVFVCHTCDVKACINPAHLYLGTPKDNTVDRDTRGRNGHRSKTRCPRGHEYTPENTYLSASGRSCKACRKATGEKWREQRRQASER